MNFCRFAGSEKHIPSVSDKSNGNLFLEATDRSKDKGLVAISLPTTSN